MATILDKILAKSNRSQLRIKDKAKVASIIEQMCAQGPKSLQVVTDFDMTLTRYHKDGTRCHSSYGVMDYSPLMPESFKSRAHHLCDIYYPIEICHKRTIAEKIPDMEIWYRESHKAIVSHQVKRSMIKAMVKGSKALLRDKAVDTLRMLNEAEVPVLVFSAGVGNVLEEVLRQHNVLYSNINITSNFMMFDEEDTVVGFKEPVIHMFNKNKAALGDSEYFNTMPSRSNVILLGDTLGDVQMTGGIENIGAVLKIGFLNINLEDNMEAFMDNFDVVLLDDQSMDFLNLVLGYVLADKDPPSKEIED